MSSQPNRLTTFPHSSHYYEKGLPRKRRSSTNEDAEKCRVVRTRDSPPPSLPTLPFHRSQQNNEPPPKVVQNTSTQNTSTNADQFRGIIAEYQAGEGIVAHRADAKFLLVLLKKKPRSRSDAKHRLTSTDHPNLVNLLTFFEDDGVINLVYECMHVSLLQLQASPYNAFVEYEIAAICKEVLQGLLYIHDELQVDHHVSCDGIFLSLQGEVKIANIGDSLLKSRPTSSKSTRSLGLLLVELIEPLTSLSDRLSLKLEMPGKWTRDLRDFLAQTDVAEVASLIEHDFLKKSPGPHCMIPHVWVGIRSIRKRPEVLTVYGSTD